MAAHQQHQQAAPVAGTSAAAAAAIVAPVVALQQRYADVSNDAALIRRLQSETLRFALQRNLFVLVRIVTREYFEICFVVTNRTLS